MRLSHASIHPINYQKKRVSTTITTHTNQSNTQLTLFIVVDEYMNQVKELENIPLDKHSADRIDRALLELEKNNYDTTKALQEMSKLTEKDFKHVVDWSQKEINAFEQSIREHGHDLNYVKMNVQTKSMADIVRFFYQWKKTDRYETVYSEWTKIYRPM